MNNELTAMQTFQENLKDKIKDDIGAMLPDDAVTEMIGRVVEEHFFKPKIVKTGNYHNPTNEKPSEFAQAVINEVKPLIKKHAKKFVDDNLKTIEEQVIKTITNSQVSYYLANQIEANISNKIHEIMQQYENT